MSRWVIYIIGFFSLVFISCQKKTKAEVDEQQDPIVSVDASVLYKADVKKSLPETLTPEDSMKAAQAYINAWIEDVLIYNRAKQNIVDQNQIDALVEDYRKSLIIHTYQDRLLKEYISENVPEKELLGFYEKNKDSFKLKENIIKGLYLKIPVESPELKNFRKWYTQTSDEAVGNIEKKQLQNAVAYNFFFDRWMSFESVMENIPFVIKDEQQFLRTKRNIEVQDSSFVYLLNIKEYKLAGGQAPYEFEKNTLVEYYLKKKESDFLKQIRADLYNKALSDKDIVFYNK